MKILWLSHSAERAGAELVLLETVRILRDEGYENVVGFNDSGPLRSELEAEGIRTLTLFLPWWADLGQGPRFVRLNFKNLLVSAKRLMAVIESERPDVVVTNTFAIGGPALAAFLKRVPHAWMIHEFMDADHGMRLLFSRPLSLIYASLLSSKIFFASETARTSFKKYFSDRQVSRFPYWVEVDHPTEVVAPPLPGFFRLVLVGTKHSGKGQHIAIKAIEILKARGVDASLELVGPSFDSYEAKLRDLTRDLGLEDRVFFVSGTTDPFRYSAGADAVLVCSKKEAFGRVTVEGMKLGRAVISSDTGAGPELIRDGETGLLFRHPDPESLADAVMRLVNEPGLKSRLGEAARTWSEENISRTRYTSNLRGFFEEAVR